MTAEIPIWVDGAVQWLSGADRRTTCRDVLELFAEGAGRGGDVSNYALIERWREVERPLDLNSRLLKIWSHWGDGQKEVKLCLRRMDHEADSGRGSPEGATTTTKRRRNKSKSSGKPALGHQEGLHPRRLAELGGFDRDAYQEYEMQRLEADISGGYAYGEKIYARTEEADHVLVHRKSAHKHCSGTGSLHSTVLDPKSKKCCSKRSGKHKVRNSENIEKLMKLILAQGATIQSQLLRLKEREEQIEDIEVERHKQRIETNGRNYLLETYLQSLKEAEVPATDEEKGNDSGVHTEAGSEQTTSGWEKDKGRDCEPTTSGSVSDVPQRTSRKERPRHCENSDRTPRSKSEGRSDKVDSKETLKRTHSDNNIPELSEISKPEEVDTKEKDDIVELRRIHSQVELLEKVFKINKKLEKEEENLVRLHIQIRRIQSENIKLAKDENSDPQTQSLQQQLEALRSDLDQNSKEIYRNFTKLIEEDEAVVQKQNNLTDLISDLEKTDQEFDFLQEILGAASSTPVAPHDGDRIGISLQVKGQEKIEEHDLKPTILESKDISENESQRSDIGVKPKILKISFDENVKNSENNYGIDKPKDPSPIPQRNLKSILKNRNRDDFLIGDIEKVPVNYGSNISPQDLDQKVSLKLTAIQDTKNVYAYPVNTYNNPIYGQQQDALYGHVADIPQRREPIYQPVSNSTMVVPRDLQSYHLPETNTSGLKHDVVTRQRVTSGTTPGYSSGVIVTTAVIHHDTDSSGSSDTSGLSSMYSASPTVDEPTYVLNTLV